MNVRRVTALAIAASSVSVFCAAPAFAGAQAPKDMVATPSVGPIGQIIQIKNAANSPCGGQQGDGPAQVDVTVTKPDSTVEPTATAFADQHGDWTLGFIDTDQVGVYQVTAYCGDVPNVPSGMSSAQATDFFYSATSFTIEAQQPTTTTTTSTTTTPTSTTTSTIAATTTTTAAAQPAVAAAATPSFTG